MFQEALAAGHTRPGDFGTLKVGTVVPGVPIAEDRVVVTVVDLYRAGHQHLPSAACQYRQAASDLDTPLAGAANLLFPGRRRSSSGPAPS